MSLTRHPSVVIVVLPMKLIPMASSLKPPAGTLLLAAEVNASEPPTDPEPGIDIHIVRLSRDGVPAEAWRRPPDVPAIALGSASQLDRRACDRLQSNLATNATRQRRICISSLREKTSGLSFMFCIRTNWHPKKIAINSMMMSNESPHCVTPYPEMK